MRQTATRMGNEGATCRGTKRGSGAKTSWGGGPDQPADLSSGLGFRVQPASWPISVSSDPRAFRPPILAAADRDPRTKNPQVHPGRKKAAIGGGATH